MLTYPGLPLTRRRSREVWGHLLDYLPVRAEERIRACGGFTQDKKQFQPYDNTLKFELGIDVQRPGEISRDRCRGAVERHSRRRRRFPPARPARDIAAPFGADCFVVARCLRSRRHVANDDAGGHLWRLCHRHLHLPAHVGHSFSVVCEGDPPQLYVMGSSGLATSLFPSPILPPSLARR